MAESNREDGPVELSGLAARIEALFHTVRRPDREQYTNEEVARACREATGESFSTTYLWQLRTGRRDNPTKRHLEALAQFFQVPPAYFFDERQGAEIAKEPRAARRAARRGRAQPGAARGRPLLRGPGHGQRADRRHRPPGRGPPEPGALTPAARAAGGADGVRG